MFQLTTKIQLFSAATPQRSRLVGMVVAGNQQGPVVEDKKRVFCA